MFKNLSGEFRPSDGRAASLHGIGHSAKARFGLTGTSNRSEFRIQSSGLRVQGSGCRVQVSGLRAKGFGLRTDWLLKPRWHHSGAKRQVCCVKRRSSVTSIGIGVSAMRLFKLTSTYRLAF